MCTIVPMHTSDSLFQKCPNCSIRVILLIWLWGRVTPPREIAFCCHCLFFFIPLIIINFFYSFPPFFSFVFLFFVLVEQFIFLSYCSIFYDTVLVWVGCFFFPVVVVFFFEISCNFFCLLLWYCYRS